MKVVQEVYWELKGFACPSCKSVMDIEETDVIYSPSSSFFVNCGRCSNRIDLPDLPPHVTKWAMDRAEEKARAEQAKAPKAREKTSWWAGFWKWINT